MAGCTLLVNGTTKVDQVLSVTLENVEKKNASLEIQLHPHLSHLASTRCHDTQSQNDYCACHLFWFKGHKVRDLPQTNTKNFGTQH